MYGRGHLAGGNNQAKRLTPRQKRQIASLYGKAPQPMGTWEPLPSLTKEETELVIKEYEQKRNKDASDLLPKDHTEGFKMQPGFVDDPSHTKVTSHLASGNLTSQNLSSPSLLQRSAYEASGARRPATEYTQTAPPHSISSMHHHDSFMSSHQRPSPSDSNRAAYTELLSTIPHSAVNKQSQVHYVHTTTQVRAPSPHSVTYTQPLGRGYEPLSSDNRTTSHVTSTCNASATLLSSPVLGSQPSTYTTTTTQNRAPPPQILSADYQPTKFVESTDYQSSQLLPLHSTSHNNHPSSTQSVSQLSTDLTSLGITLKLPSMEDMSNVDCSVLVVGVTGSGKSSACNFFIGQDLFNTAGGAIAVTAKSDAHIQTILGKRVLFIDTPGFGDEFASDEVRMAELGRAILFAKDGVTAVVLCLDGSRRFDSSVANLLKEFEVLGAFWPYTFIMYTHAADMGQTEEEQRSKISQWLGNPRCPERMKWLFDKVYHRSMAVESKQYRNSTGYYQYKCREFLNMVEGISAQNHHQKYTNQFFQWAKKKYDQVKLQKLEHERKLEETQRSLQNYQSFVALIEGDRQRKEQQQAEFVARQQRYIDNLEVQLRSCRDNERMRIQSERAEAQQQLAYSTQEHQRVVGNHSISKEKMLAKYDEDFKDYREHDWYSKREPVEFLIDDLRYELRANNRENRELREKLARMDTKLQQMQGDKVHPEDKQGSSIGGMLMEGAKVVAPAAAKYALKTVCSVM